jgi:dipeptidyl-peptidase-4
MANRFRCLSAAVFAFAIFAGAAAGVAADAPPATLIDPHPGFIEQSTATQNFSLGTPRSYQIVPGGAVLFLRSEPRSRVQELYVQEPGGAERVLMQAEKLLGGGDENLSPEEKAHRERQRNSARGIAGFQVSEDGSLVLVPLSDRLFVVDRKTGAAREMAPGAAFPLEAHFSPDAKSIACVRNGDLHVIDVAAATDRTLTTGATATLTRGTPEFVADEEMGRHEGYWWSPDGEQIAYQETDTSKVETFHIADAMHPEKPANAWPYPRPGHANADVRLGLIGRSGGTTTWVDWDRQKFPYLGSVTWSKEGPLTILVQNREQTVEQLLAVDPHSGATRKLLEETDAAWVDLYPRMPRWLPGGAGFLWISERSGSNRLELRDKNGASVRWLTPDGFGLQGFVGVEAGDKSVLVHGSVDQLQEQIWRVSLAGGNPATLSSGAGQHFATLAREGSGSVWAESLETGERRWGVHDKTGREVGTLRSVAEEPMIHPKVEYLQLGPRGFYAALVRPANFVAGRRYPVLLDVYAGPGVQPIWRHPYRFQRSQWMADFGFIVLTLDGRGTPGRGREWDRAIKGDLIDVALGDQVEGLQAAGARYPEMDLNRVGVFGWSFGGYFSAMAAMRRPDIFKAAIAGAPVADWQYYDTHYTERYLGLYDAHPDAYAKSSVLTYCKDLKIPLLVIHGTVDDNVYFLHSLMMTDALFRAGKPYDFLALPGFTHSVPDPVVQRNLQGREISFFSEHLRP